MRGLSASAMLSVLLVFAVLLWGPFSETAAAKPGITIGFAVDSKGLISSSDKGEALGRYLEGQLSIPVKVRSFAGEEQLYNWLTYFHEVDVAWFGEAFIAGVPAGQLSPLVSSQGNTTDALRGEVVAWQGMNSALCQQMTAAFLSMHENPAGKALLSQLGLTGFIALADSPSSVVNMAEQQNSSLPPSSYADPGAPVSGQNSGQVDASAAVSDPLMPHGSSIAAQPVSSIAGHPSTVAEQDSSVSAAPDSLGIDQMAPVALIADYLEYNSGEDSYEAKGDVILHQGSVELKAQELLWQATTQDAAAQGSVFLNDAGTEVVGERLQYNISTGQGQVRDGRVFVREGNFHLAGEQIEKHGQAEYFVRNGSFTTCDGDVPDWKFSASEVDVALGSYARAKNVWFHVKDVPVFYTPYLMFPVKTERESGFLMPSFGYSDRKGARTSLAWYQVIERNMDATAYLDYLSELGLGKGLEYRYALANQNDGKAIYYHVTGFSETPDLYYLEWQHNGELPGGWHLAVDGEYANKKLFFEEFGEVAEDYNRDKLVSTLVLQRNWQKLNLVGHARYLKDLEADNDGTLQRLPELGLSLAGLRLGGMPLYARLESYATRFWRREGVDGERVYLKPSLSAVFKPGTWLEVVPQVALYERLYSTDTENDNVVPEFSLALGTRLTKSYNADLWGANRIQHSIEPKLTYTYRPYEFQEDLPLFDFYDRIERRNDVTYAMVNRLTARSTAADGSNVYRELLNLRLSQSYNIDEERNNRSGERQPFSEVRIELDFQPTPNVSVDLDSRVPVYGDSGVNSLTAGASVRDDNGNAAMINYTYKDEDYADVATDYVNLQLDTSFFKPVYARFEERYDFRNNRELEKVLGLEFRSKCWSVLLTYRDRLREDEERTQEFMLTFVLAGLGQSKGFNDGFGALHQ